MSTWRDELEMALRLNGESLADVITTTFTAQQLQCVFRGAYEAFMPPFCGWTARYVYFCDCMNGDELIHSVSRNPPEKSIQFPRICTLFDGAKP